jgi:hypothetical protein
MAPKRVVEVSPIVAQGIDTWKQVRDQLSAIQRYELEYRNWLIGSVPFDPEKSEGSQTVTLPTGEKLELDRPMNYSVCKDIPTVQAAVYALWERNPAASSDIIRWVPELSVSAYKALTEDERKLIAPIVISKPGQPALKAVEKKEA